MKLIIEVSENYIKERTNEEYLLQTMDQTGASALCALTDMIAFKHILEEIDGDKTELTVNPNLIKLDDDKRKLFDRMTSMFAVAHLMFNK